MIWVWISTSLAIFLISSFLKRDRGKKIAEINIETFQDSKIYYSKPKPLQATSFTIRMTHMYCTIQNLVWPLAKLQILECKFSLRAKFGNLPLQNDFALNPEGACGFLGINSIRWAFRRLSRECLFKCTVYVYKTLQGEGQASFLKVEITLNQGHGKQTEAQRHQNLLVKYSFTSLIVLEFVGPKWLSSVK